MLQLYSNKYRETYSDHGYYGYHLQSTRFSVGDRNIRLQNNTIYFRGPSALQHADLPLHMNGLKLERNYFCYDSSLMNNETPTEIRNKLLEIYNELEDTDIRFITGYLTDSSLDASDIVDPDLWHEYKDDSIKSLFNKCAEQTSLRESERQGREIQQHIRVFKSKGKHMLLILTDYTDPDQESESFLALGLIPVIFEDFKDLFSEEEIDYFKVLVNRSQVKRISNVKATQSFNDLHLLDKYIEKERDIRYKTLFKTVAQARINTIENESRRYRDNAEQAIRTYDDALKKIHDYELLIAKYKEGSKELEEELETITKTKGVVDVKSDYSSVLDIVLRVPLEYFDTDEAECAIRNVQSNKVRQFITDIFIEQKYKLYARVESHYAYDTTSDFRDFGAVDESNCIMSKAMFNPHFQFFHCLGDYRPSLIKAMREQDLTMFVNLAIAAAKSVNFKDGAVCSRWFNYLDSLFNSNSDYYLDWKCLEKDEQLITIREWLETVEDTEETNVIEPRDL